MHRPNSRFRPVVVTACAGLATASLCILAASRPAQGQADPIARIREESLQRSQVMKTLGHLTEVIGPRLTGSPQLYRANTWTRDQLSSWGLRNAALEPWGPFGRGWSLQRFSMQMTEPDVSALIACPKAWSPGLKQTLTGPVVMVEAKDAAELEKYRGKLRGAIVLNGPVRATAARFEAPGRRYTDEQLKELENATATSPRRPGAGPGGPGGRPGGPMTGDAAERFRAQQRFAVQRLQFFVREKIGMLVDVSTRGDGGTLFVQSASVPADPELPREKRPSAWSVDAPATVPQVVMSAEHYNRLVRLISEGERPKVQVELKVRFHDDDLMNYNTVAEIPGSDRGEELVMLGGHLDSWHGGTGATDNAAGVAVAMEAVRILQACNLRPRRTIRIALWTGEEQGLFGSRAYVAQHFGKLETTTPSAEGSPPAQRLIHQPEYGRLSAYYNLDNGTGKIRGIYCQGNEAMRPLFRDWLTPFQDLGAATVTLRSTGSTDHIPFDGIGLNGFQFIQDPIEYESRTHHSNQDLYDRIQPDDLKQASAIMAAFVYHTAMRDELLPRKPLTAGVRLVQAPAPR